MKIEQMAIFSIASLRIKKLISEGLLFLRTESPRKLLNHTLKKHEYIAGINMNQFHAECWIEYQNIVILEPIFEMFFQGAIKAGIIVNFNIPIL